MDEINFGIELVFSNDTKPADDLLQKFVKRIEEVELDEDDDCPEVPDFFNNFHKYAKIEGNKIKAESPESSGNLDNEYVYVEAKSMFEKLARTFNDMKFGCKLHISYYAVDCEQDAFFKQYAVGFCESGEFKTTWEEKVSTISFKWQDEDYDGYFENYKFPQLEE